RFQSRILAVTLAVTLAISSADSAQAALDEAGRSAAYVIGEGLKPQRDGGHNRVLKALRHLADPAAQPLMAYLADSPRPAVRIHGIIGLAELDPAHRLDLQRVAQVNEPAVQAELITAALD